MAIHWTFQLRADQLAAVAITMGERLRSDGAKASMQVA
jgi:hypothetical protein